MSGLLYDAPKVGGDILAWCTRCKMELAHVVVAMLDKHPKRVICKTCKSEHNFKRETVPAYKRSSTPRTAVPKTTMRASEYWEKKMSERKGDDFIPYNIKTVFQKNHVIQHPQFGVGIVEEVRTNGKIIVIFRVGEKVLVHGMGT